MNEQTRDTPPLTAPNEPTLRNASLETFIHVLDANAKADFVGELLTEAARRLRTPRPLSANLQDCIDEVNVFMHNICMLEQPEEDQLRLILSRYLEQRPLSAAAQGAEEKLAALTLLNWTVTRLSLFDEEGVEGWRWMDPSGNEYNEIGSWDELPTWPDSASKAVRAALSLPAEGIDVKEGRLLRSLSSAELDHVSLGLTHSFGATLCGNAGDEQFVIELESGKIVSLPVNCDVAHAWSVAKSLTL